MKERSLYLNNQPIDEAFQQFLAAFHIESITEIVNVSNSLGRVTAKVVFANNNSPLYDSAAMDGIAVISENTIGASEIAPITLKYETDYVDIDTGDPIIPPFDAVIMAEDVQDLSTIHKAAAPWQNVRPIGEDVIKGEMILPGRHKIRPVDIGALLSGGISKIPVIKRPSLAIIPTGSELIDCCCDLSERIMTEPVIIESNSHMLSALAYDDNAVATRFSIVRDDYDALKQAVKTAVQNHDIVLVCSGTSAGREDYTRNILEELGQIIVHGVAMKPGKPVILAVVDNKPVIGVPGYPVSAYLAYETFVRPVIKAFLSENYSTSSYENLISAKLTRDLPSSLKHTEFVRMKVGRVGDSLIATPISRGAGASMSLVRADGFCIIPANLEGIEAGEKIKISLIRGISDIDLTIVSIGSHDLILDILADFLLKNSKIRLSSSHVGSLGGLLALQKNETHIAPIHQLDEASGEYNAPILKKMFPNRRIALIKCVGRTQGIIAAKGNPLGLKSVSDLQHARYINRQRGAGTRMLFDYLLKNDHINQLQIKGYDREAATHMAVAAAVKAGSADAGMGIMSAAIAMDLHFIEVQNEQYDFAIPAEFLELPHIESLISALKSPEFAKICSDLRGYDMRKCGDIEFI